MRKLRAAGMASMWSAMPSSTLPIFTVAPVGSTSEKVIVQLGSAKIALAMSVPTLRSSIS